MAFLQMVQSSSIMVRSGQIRPLLLSHWSVLTLKADVRICGSVMIISTLPHGSHLPQTNHGLSPQEMEKSGCMYSTGMGQGTGRRDFQTASILIQQSRWSRGSLIPLILSDIILGRRVPSALPFWTIYQGHVQFRLRYITLQINW